MLLILVMQCMTLVFGQVTTQASQNTAIGNDTFPGNLSDSMGRVIENGSTSYNKSTVPMGNILEE